MLEPEVLRNAAAMFMADLWLEYAAATDGWIKGIRLFCKSKRCQKSILSSLRFLFPPLPGCYVICFGASDRISIERSLSSRIWTSTSHVFFVSLGDCTKLCTPCTMCLPYCWGLASLNAFPVKKDLKKLQLQPQGWYVCIYSIFTTLQHDVLMYN